MSEFIDKTQSVTNYDTHQIAYYGWTKEYNELVTTSGFVAGKDEIPARITAMHRGRYEVVCTHGTISAVVTGSFLYKNRGKNGQHTNPEQTEMPVTGDFVFLKYNNTGDSQITRVCPRRTQFLRTDFSGHAAGYVKTMKEQVLAANFDTVFILSSLNKEFNERKVGRFIAAAIQSGAKPVVVLTKKDKSDDTNTEVCIALVSAISAEVPVVAVSALTGDGMNQLKPFLCPGKTLVFLGASGVGKSTLVNALMGDNIMDTAGIREDDDKGRHTTTHRELIMCGDVMIMDTPGIREIGLWDTSEAISDVYADITDLIARCRFSNCSHQNEPGCAIREALESGTLDENRWKEYRRLQDETTWAQRKAVINGKKRPYMR